MLHQNKAIKAFMATQWRSNGFIEATSSRETGSDPAAGEDRSHLSVCRDGTEDNAPVFNSLVDMASLVWTSSHESESDYQASDE